METQHSYWKLKYQGLEKEFIQLKSEHIQLKLLYEQAIEGSLHDINQMNMLRLENEQLKNTISELKGSPITKKSEEINTLEPNLKKTQCTLSHLNLFSPQKRNYYSNDDWYPLESVEINTDSCVKQALPDQSISFECNDPNLYVSFLIISVSADKLGSGLNFPPEIVYEYPESSFQLSSDIRKILADCCFPSGVDVRPMKLSSSASELNSLLYGQTQNKRGNNCYIFTLKSTQLEKEHGELPNSNQEVMYMICLQIEDLSMQPDKQVEWVVPKVYCFVSFIPIFELHYEMIFSMLSLKRINRMKSLINEEDLGKEELLCKDERRALSAYAEIELVQDAELIEISIENLDKIIYEFPEDMSMIDIPWLCGPLFSTLEFNDFFWLFCAVLQEKSVVLVSSNKGLLTSCVLGFTALLRPFRWPNLLIPIVPNSVIDLLDAPVPLLAGICQRPTNKENIIWVMLDEPMISARIQGDTTTVQTVIEPAASQLKQRIQNIFGLLPKKAACFNPNPQEKMIILEIASAIKEYFSYITAEIEINRYIGVDGLQNKILSQFPKEDHAFINAVMQTQLFSNMRDELILVP
ncbi:unnamed protein product [Blepharisma stoltei]|uniref:UDENN domain-containing protein n=1 Tax=Blepharisma stoltei TaxID=1481888 RepID=A0AAU9IQ37_9CILI|nr:unnamed protein product [Blepharisma stoltei]